MPVPQPAAKNGQKCEKGVGNRKITESFVLDPSGVANERFFICRLTLPDPQLNYQKFKMVISFQDPRLQKIPQWYQIPFL